MGELKSDKKLRFNPCLNVVEFAQFLHLFCKSLRLCDTSPVEIKGWVAPFSMVLDAGTVFQLQ